MKQGYFYLIILLTLNLPVTGHTQGKATAIDSLAVDLWPDYDRTSVLVLLTGALPADTTLPSTVTLPMPKTAKLNAVARIDRSDGQMKDDIFFIPVPEGVSFNTPDLRFRVEYYLPYAVKKDQRTFNFSWLADITVNKLKLKVQRPLFASQLATEPASINVIRGEDGFTYYVFPEQAISAGQSFSVQVNYSMPTDQLSVEGLTPPGTRTQEPGLPSTVKTGADFNWKIIAVVTGGIIMLMVFVWKIATRRARSNGSAAQKTVAKRKSDSKFCSNCDNPVDLDDRFCSKCGAAL